MNRTLIHALSMVTICAAMPTALACGMPPGPNEPFFSSIDPVDALFVILATLTIGIAVWPSLQKLLGRSKPAAE